VFHGLQGYVEDPLNTDNAWLETIATNYHDEHDRVFHLMQPQSSDENLEFVWEHLRGDLGVRANQRDYLAQVGNPCYFHLHSSAFRLPSFAVRTGLIRCLMPRSLRPLVAARTLSVDDA
jgi:hypothetical protein